MLMEKTIPTHVKHIDEYISTFPDDVQMRLEQMLAAIKQAAPQLTETIKYAIPTFTLHGNVVSFAAWKKHIGFYPAPIGVEAFKEALEMYQTSKSTMKFLMDEPLPIPLIKEMVKYLVKRDEEKAEEKKKKMK